MTVHCTLHPSKSAHFQCNRCSSAFCGKCIVKRAVPEDFGVTVNAYICPFCDVEADQLGVGNLLAPFWTRMPKFFLYPVQTAPLVIALALSLLTGFFSTSKLVALFSFIVSTKYAYAILINTAQGDLRAPAPGFELFNSDIGQVFKQYAVFFTLAFIAMQLFRYTGPLGAFFFIPIALILLPAMLMLLVATNSVIVAMNPMIVVPMVFRIGWRYLLMLLFLGLLPAGPLALLSLLPKTIPWGITAFLSAFLQHYYTFISYNLMGYVLLQYHEEIGYDVDYEHFTACSVPKDEQGPQDPVLVRRHQVDILIRSGRHETALKLLQEDLKENQDDLVLSGKYLDLLRVCRKKKEYVLHAPVYLQQLIRKKKTTKALKIYQELIADGTIPVPIDSSLAVGKWMFDRNEYRKAGNCYLRCIKKNPKHPKLPEAYFPFIQLLHERFDKTDKAVQLSKGVIRTWPDHPLISEIKTYLNNML